MRNRSKTLKNQVFHLLGSSCNYQSGVHREGLLRQFLRSILPTALSVDSGFIHGFDEVPTSGQLDILIWKSATHAPVFRAQDFVIVSPESVVAVLSVKTGLQSRDIESGIKNLLTVAPLDLEYRGRTRKDGTPLLPPILKALVAYESPRDILSALESAAQTLREEVATDSRLVAAVEEALRNVDLSNPAPTPWYPVERVYPRLVCAIEPPGQSYLRGLGPPEDLEAQRTYGRGLRRVPYLYAQEEKLTSPFEKLIYYVLSASYRALDTVDISTTAAWGDFNPRTGMRLGDASELVEELGRPLLDIGEGGPIPGGDLR